MARTGNIVITQGTQDFVNATTPITVVGTITTTDGSYRGDHRTGTITVKQGNTTIYSETFTHGAPANATTTLFTVELTVQHDANGNAGVITASYNYDNGWCTASATLSIPSISRASVLDIKDGVLGTVQGYTITRENSNYSHKLRFVCGNLSGYIMGSDIITSPTVSDKNWAPPIEWATQNTTGSEVLVVFTLETYSGSTMIGDNSYTRTFEIPSSVAPTVTITTTDPTGYFDTYGDYVKGKSKIRVVLSVEGAQGSTISSYKIVANGRTYTQADITTGIITFVGNHEITASVTDSRERTTVATKTIASKDYAAPKLFDVKVFRCDSDGASNVAGDHLCAQFSSEVSSLNGFNSAVYKVKYKKKTTGVSKTETLTAYDKQYNVVDGTYVFAADTTSSYEVTVSVTDDFQTTPITKTGPTIRIQSCRFATGAHGIAFGKYAELEDAFDVGWPGHFREGLTVYDSTGKAYSLIDVIASLAGYLPLSGGTLTGEVIVDSNALSARKTVNDAIKKVKLLIDTTGDAYLSFFSAGFQQNYMSMGSSDVEFGSGITAKGAVTAAQGSGFIVGSAIINSPASQSLYLGASGETNYRLYYGVRDSMWTLTPSVSGNCNLGTPNYKWEQIYANNSTISTSDRNEKLDVGDLDKELSSAFVLAIPTKTFKMIDGNSGRTHWGMVSQDVWDVMQSLGISDMDFAGFIRYHKSHTEEHTLVAVNEGTGEETTQTYTEDVYEYDEDGNPVYGYGLRYEEFIAPMIATIQKQQEKIEYLENEIATIKAALGL